MMLTFGKLPVPWNAGWTGEHHHEIRPCRWAEGKPAMWQPHRPGDGRPVFAKPHFVRQRQSVSRMLCTVCGEHTPPADRWWFQHGERRDGLFMTTEAPVHHECALVSLELCPHLRSTPAKQALSKFPGGYQIVVSMLGGQRTEHDFGVKLGRGRLIVGALKFAWPASMFITQDEVA
jgi:hypothetical protein